jgi:long-chain acyl-CoA synthetase
LITLDPEAVQALAQDQGWEESDVAAIAKREEVGEIVQNAVDEVNSKVARVEQIKKFTILPEDLSQETGELTPTLKVKRNVVYDKYAKEYERLYDN